MSQTPLQDRPLVGLRIIDMVRGPLAPLTRYLAELGATVERFADGCADPIVDAAANGAKQTAADPDLALECAHAIVADTGRQIAFDALRSSRPSLVTMTVSDFGTDTSLTDWQATDPVLHALSGELSRSGIRAREPLLPPGELAYQCAAAQGAFVLASALYRALRTGQGDHIDFSALDGAVQALDPGYGISGSATMGKPAHLLSRDRPARGFQYPILRCADGRVRVCLLSKRQWQGMFGWMGEPAAFASPDFENMGVRYKSSELMQAIAAFFAGRTRAELEAEGQRHGVPISAVLDFEEAIAADHFRERDAFRTVGLPDGEEVVLPNGVMTIDGDRMTPDPIAAVREWPAPSCRGPLPFEGLRVLDLGVIVVGAEQGRLLGDGGADVLKIESRAYPDGNRQSYLSYGMSASFAAGHRNKRSIGINLRHPEGCALFLDLARRADVILSNFKSGTMNSLGLSYDRIAAINPAIVMSESSAFGSTGSWSSRMGYGPLVRAATGLTQAWRYPDDPDGFCDSVTIYPDHVAARISAIGVVALLIRRLRTGWGGTVNVSQAEVMLAHFAADVGRASRGQLAVGPPDHPWGVYQAGGDDEWCVVTVRGTDDWLRLAAVIGFDGADALATSKARLDARASVDRALRAWLGERSADAAMRTLQASGVPAARMLRVADLPAFEYFVERGLFRVEPHPYLREEVVAERWAAKREGAPEAPSFPAPLMGEHSSEAVLDWLPEVDVAAMVAAAVLEPLDEATLAAARSGARPASDATAKARA